MIYGTRHSPGMAFIEFARGFFEAIAVGDFQAGLGQLDANDRRWSKSSLMSELNRVIGNQTICTLAGIPKSAEPELIPLENGDYQLVHKIPVAGKWSTAKVRFQFVARKHGNQFSVNLLGFEP